MTTYYTLFPTPVPRRILVIGGGPCGLITLRNLIEHGNFEHVELYERRDDVGGVWYFDDANISTKSDSTRWPSPPEFLSFSGSPFPEPPGTPTQPFPTLKETHDYLRNFAAPYLASGAIKLNREVLRVTELGNDQGWSVVSKNWTHGANRAETEEIWDAVVIAVGWFDNPVWPNTPGLEELKNMGLAKHAKWWRGPKGYEGKKMLVIGNANSGNDISSQLAKSAHLPVYQSIRRPAFSNYPSLEDKRITKVATVSRYVIRDDTFTSQKFDALLADDTLLKDLDFVQVGTGYRPFPSFVHVLGHSREDEGTIVPLVTEDTKPNRVPSLHRLIMYAHNPTLAFVGTTLSYTPFTIADVSSIWLALAWAGEVSYPDTPLGRLHYEKERLEAIEKRRQAMNCPSSLMVYNILGQDEQEYAQSLRDDIVGARPALGRIVPLWNDERTAHRESMYKKKYDALSYSRSLSQSTV